LVGLGDRMKHLPGQLSGGQRQRVAVARALVNQPALVLADEPTGELDSERTAEIIQTMHRLNQEMGMTFVIVTHDPAIGRETGRIIELDSGRILREHVVGDVFDEAWKTLRNSPLGQALLNGGRKDLAVAGKLLYENGELTETGRLLREMLGQTE
jgi:ABC-type methionine transport system ATPase subunit